MPNHSDNVVKAKEGWLQWRDCRNLIDDTIIQLNSTLQGIQTNNSFTDFDAQTWLSTALTYIETCHSGSLELNVSNFISPIVSGNASELISNSLAINGGLLDQAQPEYKDEEFPSWVTSRERHLLTDMELASRANVIVAKDGSGAFKSIQAAINYATSRRVGNGRVVIYIKRGVYRENVAISRTMNKVMLVGDGLRYTIITGSRSVSQGFTTYSSATGLMELDLLPVASRSGTRQGRTMVRPSPSGQPPDLSVFYACGFEGYQDTLFVHAQRQFYKACYVYGTIDFIFGNAAVVFQNCIIYVRKPLVGQANVITAQGRGDPFQNTGISIHNSRIMAAPDLKPVVGQFKTYLGRPWQQYSRTVILKSFIDSLVSPDGWLKWQDSNFALSTLYYWRIQ
ncbi:putative pectinesterase/pectinesterase inhibitor 60 [Forsythia ovata]|uniref:Pectinesterase n=1 Tax=Forsythia ovata TaxID=205694 RepID=A0ABD1X1X5_9LAMI